jgi:hypothetical protein
MQQSIHLTAGMREHALCETSFRYHLKKLAIGELGEKSAAILAHTVYQVLKPGNTYQVAIDYTIDFYYGKTFDENASDILRSKRKQSMNEFYSYVTLHVTINDQQLTLAVYPVQQSVSRVGYIARCLNRIAGLGLEVEILSQNWEFYTRKVFGFLTRVFPDDCHCCEVCQGETRKTWRWESGLCCRRYCLASTPGALDIPFTVLDRVVLPDAQPGETEGQHEEPGDPVSLCHNFFPPKELLDRSPVDAFFASEAGTENHRNARVPIRLLHCHNRGSDPGSDGDGEKNFHPAVSGLEKGWWKDVE